MSERARKRPVPCMKCIERASMDGTMPDTLSLCNQCTAMLQSRNGSRLPQPSLDNASLGSSLPLLQPEGLADASIRGLRKGQKAPSTTSRQETIDLITSYSRQFVAAVNARDFDHPIWDRRTKDVHCSSFDRYSPTSTLDDNIRTFQAIATNDPTYHIEMRNVDVIFDEGDETVHAYSDQRITGRPEGVVMDCVAVFTYRRKAGEWKLVAFNAVRCPGLAV